MAANYDHPNFLIIREKSLSGAISAAGVGSAYVGSSLKVAQKALVLGVTFRVGSAGSAIATNSIKVARVDLAGTQSAMQVYTFGASAGMTDVYDISLTTGFTVHSLGEAAALNGNAASLDKVVVLSDVIWRYRLLPANDIPSIANLG